MCNLNVSVVVVTHDRPHICKKTLESLLSQSLLPLEIVVVDDASSRPFQFNHHMVKVIRNQFEIGLSASRNIGIKISKGNIVAFIDDDAIADKDWVKKMVTAFQMHNADIIGGLVLPLFLSKPPKWFDTKQFGICIGVNRKGMIIGCNFAVKKIVFEKIGYFNENLGRKHGKLLSGEEIEFFRRAKNAGLRILFTPDSKVHHIVPPQRLKLHYLMRRMWWEGITQSYYYLTLPENIIGKAILEVSLRKMGSMMLSALSILFTPKNRIKGLLTLIMQMGFFFAILKRAA